MKFAAAVLSMFLMVAVNNIGQANNNNDPNVQLKTISSMLESAVQIRVQLTKKIIGVTFKDGKLQKFETSKVINVFGSGTIVKKIKDKNTYTYNVLTCRHLFDHIKGDINKDTKFGIWITVFSYRAYGKGGMNFYPTKDFWLPKAKIKGNEVDLAFITFKTNDVLRAAKVAKDMPKNIFGYKALGVGYQYSLTPVIMYGYFGANSPYPSKTIGNEIVGISCMGANGCSGAAMYGYHNNTWQIFGLYIFNINPDRSGMSNIGGVFRMDAIITVLMARKKLDFIGE